MTKRFGKEVRDWSSQEIDFLKENYINLSDAELGRSLKRSSSSISYKTGKLGLHSASKELIKLSLQESEAAYIAGLLDGEGSFLLAAVFSKAGNYKRSTPVIEISNSNKEVLDWLSEKVKISGRWRSKKVYKKEENRYLGRHWHYHLCIAGTIRLKPLLQAILPFLIIKKRHAELLLEYIITHRYGHGTVRDLELTILLREATDSRKHINRQRIKKLKESLHSMFPQDDLVVSGSIHRS